MSETTPDPVVARWAEPAGAPGWVLAGTRVEEALRALVTDGLLTRRQSALVACGTGE